LVDGVHYLISDSLSHLGWPDRARPNRSSSVKK
jgi:hypothetical protein